MRHPACALLLTIAALTTSVAACGGDDPATEVRATLDAFAKATATKDFQRMCDELFATKLVEKVRQQVPCEVALQNSSINDARAPKLVVRSVKVDGDTATAVVDTSAANQKPSRDTVRLVREKGGWRIIALAS